MSNRAALLVAAAVALLLVVVGLSPDRTQPFPARPVPAPAAATSPDPVRAAPPARPVPSAEASPPSAAGAVAERAPLSEPLPEAAVPEPEIVARRNTGEIRGWLRAADGRPLAGVRVLGVAADLSDAAEDVTDGEGRYFLLALRPGRYAVFAGLGTSVASRVGGRGAAVTAGEVTAVALEERRDGATVRVRVLDASGRETPAQAVLVPAVAEAPAALAAVLASEAILLPGTALTVVEAVPPGRYAVVLLQGENLVRAPAEVEVGEAGDVVVEVPLPPAVAVTAL